MNTKDIGRKPRQRQPLGVETRKHYVVNVKTCETLVATFSRAVYIFSPHVATAHSYLTRKINTYSIYNHVYIYIYILLYQSNDEIHGPSASLILAQLAVCTSLCV